MTDASPELNFIPLEPFDNHTIPTGGDSADFDLNVFYNAADVVFVFLCNALVLLMIPGVGFFYSGLARRKSALSLIFLTLAATCVVSFQWFFWGYSLVFSHQAGKFIGALDNIGLRHVLAYPSVGSKKVPDLLYALYNGMFASFTAALVIGSTAERGRLLPCLIFLFIWTTIVYDPIACWTWNPKGWSYRMGGLDFAGGTPVHITSGTASLVYSYMLGKRRGYGSQELNYRPHNVTHIAIGTVMMWVGWLGFNSGPVLSANLRAVVAALNTNLSACAGGITWVLVDYRHEYKLSAVGLCSGIVAGLVCITPGSGFVPPWAALVYGVCGALFANYATKLKYVLRCDDALDVFAVHGIGGFTGNILTAFFAADYITHLDGVTRIPGGWINGHWIQLGYQLADSVAGAAYSFVVTLVILVIIDYVGNFIPALRLRVLNDEDELLGIDHIEIGEYAYDYVELLRDLPIVEEDESDK